MTEAQAKRLYQTIKSYADAAAQDAYFFWSAKKNPYPNDVQWSDAELLKACMALVTNQPQVDKASGGL